jgi:hypothetical protein
MLVRLSLGFFLIVSGFTPNALAAPENNERITPTQFKKAIACGVALVSAGITYTLGHQGAEAFTEFTGYYSSASDLRTMASALAVPGFLVAWRTAKKLMELKNPFTLYDVLSGAGLFGGTAVGLFAGLNLPPDFGAIGTGASGAIGMGSGWLLANVVDMSIRRHQKGEGKTPALSAEVCIRTAFRDPESVSLADAKDSIPAALLRKSVHLSEVGVPHYVVQKVAAGQRTLYFVVIATRTMATSGVDGLIVFGGPDSHAHVSSGAVVQVLH